MTDTTEEFTITLEFDWGAGPFWISVGDEIPYDCSSDDIAEVVPLSDDLLSAAEEWYERMQSTYNDDDPQDIGISDPAEEARWIADGRKLAQRLKNEVGPDVRVEYSPLGGPTEIINE